MGRNQLLPLLLLGLGVLLVLLMGCCRSHPAARGPCWGVLMMLLLLQLLLVLLWTGALARH
jgi:hypothetical protein